MRMMQIPMANGRVFVCLVGPGMVCNLGKAFGVAEERTERSCWRAIYDCLCGSN